MMMVFVITPGQGLGGAGESAGQSAPPATEQDPHPLLPARPHQRPVPSNLCHGESVTPQQLNLETFEQICMYIKFYRFNLIFYRYLSCFRYVYFKSTFIFIFEDSYLVLS